ncbi:MAG: PAS domain S-box protein, partial [Bdellovibrionota bacterium]
MPQTPKSSNSNPIVLLVDDREENLLAFETCLQNLDCEIVTAKSGRKAIDYLKKNEVAAVVLDVQMPEMDGFEVAKIVRELEIAATTPILFVTALDRNDVHEELAYKLGAVDFVYKPVSAEALAGKVGFFITLYTRSKELERKNALLLDNAEAEKTTLLENALDAVVGVDENNRILFWNKHAATMFGWSKEEVLLQDMTTLIVPERHHTAHRMGMKRFIETGLQKIQNRRLEIPGIRKGGDEFLLELTVSSVKSNSGYRFYSFMRDISEAKKAETLLRESESKFRSLTEALPTIVFTTNAAGDTFHINDRWGKYTGKEFSPTAWQDAMHPDDLAIVHESWEKARANKSKWVVEYRLRRSDGVYRWQLGTSVPELSNDGEILRWIGAVVDIEDQKVVARTLEETNLSLESKVQERTKELTQAYRFVDSVLENIPNMIFVKDATDLKFVRFNKAGEELLGVSKTDLIGKNDYDFFPKSEADAFQAKDRSVLSGRTIVDIDEEPISTKNKGLRTLHTKKIPVYDSTGKPSFLIGISEDITERKIVERERLDLIEAQKVNRLKDEFLANLSHELRTPMNVIQGHADILADYAAKLPEDFRSSVEAIQRNAKAQTAIITDLLDVSSIITGKVSYHSSEISPAVLVGQVIEGFVPTAESKGVTLEHLSATCPTSVSAD